LHKIQSNLALSALTAKILSNIFPQGSTMKKFIIAFFLALTFLSLNVSAQIQTNVLVQIVKAEDERRFDKVLEDLMENPNAKIRTRAALAAGRIGKMRRFRRSRRFWKTIKTRKCAQWRRSRSAKSNQSKRRTQF